ncbi:hypothetical protein [Thermogymnomonas acidicola]|uniref:isocitrate/isopropylmalate family dehydrogenase n=1 Tax=Thermogymnomonas acidicola TaxID=399579 RepID=UPI001494BCC7|nr:isocitrate/isopropylmalate family dehydrogenase [Thermogymnomonas acidicola]
MRENTEDFYADRNMFRGSGEFMPTPDVAMSLRVITRAKSQKISEVAFRYAMGGRRKKVTAVHKGNVLRMTDGLFLQAFRQVASRYPEVKAEDRIVDSTAYDMVLHPEKFDVIVTTNMFGDILSDEAAAFGDTSWHPRSTLATALPWPRPSTGPHLTLQGKGYRTPPYPRYSPCPCSCPGSLRGRASGTWRR